MHEFPKLHPFNTELSKFWKLLTEPWEEEKIFFFFVHTSLENETNRDLLKPSYII